MYIVLTIKEVCCCSPHEKKTITKHFNKNYAVVDELGGEMSVNKPLIQVKAGKRSGCNFTRVDFLSKHHWQSEGSSE